MALKDALMVLVAVALPIWLLAEQVVWWASSKESQAERDSASLPVEPPTKKDTVVARPGQMFPPLPRKVA